MYHWLRFSRPTAVPGKRRARWNPQIEVLEDRCVPSFVTATYPTADGGPAGTIAADKLTDSGVTDLVMGQQNYTMGVYLGNGDGTFQPAGSYLAGGGTVKLADLRSNGISDIVASGGPVGTVEVLLGNGDGTFKPRRQYFVGEGAANVVVADLTGNGIPDIATANLVDGTVSVLLGNGDGTFKPAVSYAVGTRPIQIVAGPFGGDSGLPDLAVVNNGSGTVSVLVNRGDGLFGRRVDYPVGSAPFGIVLGDFAHSGTLDIAVASTSSNSISLLVGNGDATFQPARSISVPGGPTSLVATDFKNDGNLDLAVTLQFANRVGVLLGDGTGNFAAPLEFPTGATPLGIVTADLTNDGYADLVTANGPGSYTVLLNDGMWDTAPQGSRSHASVVGGVVQAVTPSGNVQSPGVGGFGVHDHVLSDSILAGVSATTAGSEVASRQALLLFPLASEVSSSARTAHLLQSDLGILDRLWIAFGGRDDADTEAFYRMH